MITVVNKRSGGKGIYIGRGNKHNKGSVLGNPFKMKHEGDRDRVVHQYHQWLEQHFQQDPNGLVCQEVHRIANQVKRGRNVNLVCWCAPKRCHGDIVKAKVEELLNSSAEATSNSPSKPANGSTTNNHQKQRAVRSNGGSWNISRQAQQPCPRWDSPQFRLNDESAFPPLGT